MLTNLQSLFSLTILALQAISFFSYIVDQNFVDKPSIIFILFNISSFFIYTRISDVLLLSFYVLYIAHVGLYIEHSINVVYKIK